MKKRLVLIVTTLVMSACRGEVDPSDDQMLRNFQEHRAAFEKLRDMILEDRDLQRVDRDWTDPADPATIGITSQRIAEYRKLFRELGIARGFQAYGDRSEIRLLAHAEGLSVAG